MSTFISKRRSTRSIRRSRKRGALLGVVLILIAILFAAGVFALSSMRSDTAAAGRDRLSRQLFDCAEQGLAWGKQYFSTTARSQWSAYLAASNVCTASISSSPAIGPLPCYPNGPFPTGGTGAPVAGYPNQAPYTQSIKMDPRGGNDFQFTVGIYSDPANILPFSSANNRIVVYSRCTDLASLQSRAVQVLLSVPPSATNDYKGQAGRGFRNQGNQNF
jgi:hypothetical protein